MSQVNHQIERVANSLDPRQGDGVRVAVLIPCYNEEAAIATVVTDFRRVLPDAAIYVYDNASSDDTFAVAESAGAIVASEPRRGKGNVVRRMFADVEADVYVLVDGDDTYEAAAAPDLIRRLRREQLDMVNAARERSDAAAYRRGHRFGNSLFSNLISTVFGHQFDDILSGYRILSRRFVKTFPAMASGFEIETELTVHALELRMPVAEVMTRYKERPDGSESKLSTFRDGFRILRTIIHLVKEERPLAFFGGAFLVLVLLSVVLAYPLVLTYIDTGLVPRIPTAILSSGIMVLAFLSLTCGLILDTVTRGRREAKRLRYLEFSSPTRPGAPAP
jgi:glycosyltransferase involved in cell wall biosynthesis